MSLLGHNAVPDSSGNVYIEPYPVKATNDVWGFLVVVFADTGTRIGMRGAASVPKNYNTGGTVKIVVVWTSTATSGNVVWDFDYRGVGGNDSESLDQTGNQEALTVTDAAPGAAHRRLEALMTVTASNLAADDVLEWELFRDGANGSDTMAAAAIVVDVLLEYTD